MSDHSKTFTEEDLRDRLTPLQYHVTQESGTEQAFTGETWDQKQDGTYHCVVCDADLFSMNLNTSRALAGRVFGSPYLTLSSTQRSTHPMEWFVSKLYVMHAELIWATFSPMALNPLVIATA